MRVFRGFDNLPPFTHAVATMGSFDGVHCGHQVLLQRITSLATERGGESIVLTFEPHPRYVLGKGEGMKLLSTLEEKLWLLERYGVDNVIVIPFTQEFSRTSPDDFITKYIAGIGVERFVVGYNHRFGHNKAGDYSALKDSQRTLEIDMVEQQLLDNNKVSSTVIREVIERGDITLANELMAHPYIIMASVNTEGTIAELDENKLLPPNGEYAAIIHYTNANSQNTNKIDNSIKATLKVEDGRFSIINHSGKKGKATIELTGDK